MITRRSMVINDCVDMESAANKSLSDWMAIVSFRFHLAFWLAVLPGPWLDSIDGENARDVCLHKLVKSWHVHSPSNQRRMSIVGPHQHDELPCNMDSLGGAQIGELYKRHPRGLLNSSTLGLLLLVFESMHSYAVIHTSYSAFY
mmetsp:Transcript_20133/g.43413  ORF Transcript_20133/g.43413 Transcript_20133/m.43413 type:complete len:144 (-) Transcript_20133:44-475(-)